MKGYAKNMLLALLCFLLVLILNFLLPRLLPGDPIAYLTGFAEEDMTPRQVAFYRKALHLDESGPVQFFHYLASLLDGSLGYSFKKESTVSALIGKRLGATLQITLPAWLLSSLLGLLWGLRSGYGRGSLPDRLSTAALIVLNTVPTFLIGLLLLILCCFQNRWFPYASLSSPEAGEGLHWLGDRLWHLCLPVLTLTLAELPSRFLLLRNMSAVAADEKYILYAKERGLPERQIRFRYLLPNIAQPFITMLGMSLSACIAGSLVVENLFSINGMGLLLSEAVYSLDYPLLQGILFVTTLAAVLSILFTDLLCMLLDPRVRWGEQT